MALGPSASNAVPALIRIGEQTHSLDSQCAVLYALAWIGPAAEPALPMLLDDATSANPRIRGGTLWALGEIRAQPSLVVPVLQNALTCSNTWVQTCAARALGNFGASAELALPALSAATKRAASSGYGVNTEAQVEAANAIRKIEAAQQEQSDPLTAFSLQ
jgi:HEAT repeat protein